MPPPGRRSCSRPDVLVSAPRLARPQERGDTAASHWLMSALMLLAIGTAAAGLNSVIADVAWWFTGCLSVIQPSVEYGPLIELLADEAEFRTFATDFLQNVGTGISGLDVERPTESSRPWLRSGERSPVTFAPLAA